MVGDRNHVEPLGLAVEVDDDRRLPQALTGSRPASWSSQQPVAGETPTFRMGEDVAHPAFGDGVVTGSEPGGVVVVRFASDGAERKLMAVYAPLRKAS